MDNRPPDTLAERASQAVQHWWVGATEAAAEVAPLINPNDPADAIETALKITALASAFDLALAAPEWAAIFLEGMRGGADHEAESRSWAQEFVRTHPLP